MKRIQQAAVHTALIYLHQVIHSEELGLCSTFRVIPGKSVTKHSNFQPPLLSLSIISNVRWMSLTESLDKYMQHAPCIIYYHDRSVMHVRQQLTIYMDFESTRSERGLTARQYYYVSLLLTSTQTILCISM